MQQVGGIKHEIGEVRQESRLRPPEFRLLPDCTYFVFAGTCLLDLFGLPASVGRQRSLCIVQQPLPPLPRHVVLRPPPPDVSAAGAPRLPPPASGTHTQKVTT